MSEWGKGGYLPGKGVKAYLHPDECVIRAADVAAGRYVCSRPGHAGRECQQAQPVEPTIWTDG